MTKAIALIALSLALEAGFLLTIAVPAHRPVAAPTQLASERAPESGVAQAPATPPARS